MRDNSWTTQCSLSPYPTVCRLVSTALSLQKAQALSLRPSWGLSGSGAASLCPHLSSRSEVPVVRTAWGDEGGTMGCRGGGQNVRDVCIMSNLHVPWAKFILQCIIPPRFPGSLWETARCPCHFSLCTQSKAQRGTDKWLTRAAAGKTGLHGH